MIDQKLILLPLIAQVFLTIVVSLWTYHTRVSEMKKKRIHPQSLATAAGAAEKLKAVANIADNFTNLFEVPVLFYVASIVLYVTQMVDWVFVALMASFVFFRCIHSFIHITYNKVMHRFYLYAISTLLLWTVWAMIAIRIISDLNS
jgi:hypothetical protein